MERGEVEVLKKLLKIFCLMFCVAPTSERSTLTLTLVIPIHTDTPQHHCLARYPGPYETRPGPQSTGIHWLHLHPSLLLSRQSPREISDPFVHVLCASIFVSSAGSDTSANARFGSGTDNKVNAIQAAGGRAELVAGGWCRSETVSE